MDYRYLLHRVGVHRSKFAFFALLAVAVFAFINSTQPSDSPQLASEAPATESSVQEQAFSVVDQPTLATTSAQEEPDAETSEEAPTAEDPTPEQSDNPQNTDEAVEPQPEEPVDAKPVAEEEAEEPGLQAPSINVTSDGCYVTAFAPSDMTLEIHSFNNKKGRISEHMISAGETINVLSGGGLAGMTVDAKLIDADGAVHAQEIGTITIDACWDNSPYTP